METITCRETWLTMSALTQKGAVVRNFTRRIRMADYLVETDLFTREALEAYTAWNLEKEVPEEQRRMFFSAHRGGA